MSGGVYDVQIDGIKIPFKDHQWAVTGGIAAPIQSWRVPNPVADDLMKKVGQEITLQLDTLVVKRVILLGNGPADDWQDQLVQLTDPRWYYTRRWLVLTANKKRRVGDFHLLGSNPAQVVSIPSVQYLPWSINNDSPFDWDSLSKRAQALSSDLDGIKITWTTDTGGLNIGPRVVEELDNDSPMPVGLLRAIGSVPGRSVYADINGVLHIYDAVPGREKSMVDRIRDYHLDGHGDLTWCNRSGTRAPRTRVYSTPELEVRIDRNPVGTFGVNDPYMEPVIRQPDLSLDIPAQDPPTPSSPGVPARTTGMNSWLLPKEIYGGWGPGGLQGMVLTDDIVREGYLTGGLKYNYVYQTPPIPDFVWARRIEAIYECWRRTYRVNPRFWARVLSAMEVMASVWDSANGVRAPSPVFVNVAKRYEIRWLVANASGTAFNDDQSYPTNGLIASGKPQTMRVVIRDWEQGILEFTPDFRSGTFNDMAPSAFDGGIVPSLEPGDDPLLQAITWNSRYLCPEDSHKIITILSCIPAAPPDVRRLYSMMVDIKDAAGYLGLGAVPEAAGPIQECRTFGATARFAYSDDQDVRDQILSYFQTDGADASVSATDPTLTGKAMKPLNYESEIKPLSIAFAAADLYYRLDHYEGQMAVPLDATLAPVGSVHKVVHRVVSDAAQTLVMAAPIDGVAPSPFDLLPATARTAILHLVQESRA